MTLFKSLDEAIEKHQSDGYTEYFHLVYDCLECMNGTFQIFHDEFEVDGHCLLAGTAEYPEGAVVYAISSTKFQMKGVLVIPHGNFAEGIIPEMTEKLKVN